MDAADLARWTRFAAKGGIGKCTAVRDCVAERAEDLMFLQGDEITVLMQLPEAEGCFLGFCEDVVGRFQVGDVQIHGKLKKPVMTKRLSNRSSMTASHAQTPPSPVIIRSSLSPMTPTSRGQHLEPNEVLRPPSTSHSSWSPASDAPFTPTTPPDLPKVNVVKDVDVPPPRMGLELGRGNQAGDGRMSTLTDAQPHGRDPYESASDRSPTTYASNASNNASAPPSTSTPRSSASDMYRDASTRLHERMSAFSDGEFGIGLSLMQDAGSEEESDDDAPATARLPTMPPLPVMRNIPVRPDSQNSTVEGHGFPPPRYGPFTPAVSQSRTHTPDHFPSRPSTRASDLGDQDWEGADDIYDDYRYSRFSVASKMSGFSKASSKVSLHSKASGSKSVGQSIPDDRPLVPPVPYDARVGHDKSESISTLQSTSSQYSMDDSASFADSDQMERMTRAIMEETVLPPSTPTPPPLDLEPIATPPVGPPEAVETPPPPQPTQPPANSTPFVIPRRTASLHHKAVPPPLMLTPATNNTPSLSVLSPTLLSPAQTTAPLRIRPSPTRAVMGVTSPVTSPLLHTEFDTPTMFSSNAHSLMSPTAILPPAPSGIASALRAQMEEGRAPQLSPVESPTPSIESRLNDLDQSLESGDIHDDEMGSEAPRSARSGDRSSWVEESSVVDRSSWAEDKDGSGSGDDDGSEKSGEDGEDDGSAEGDGEDTVEGIRQDFARDSFAPSRFPVREDSEEHLLAPQETPSHLQLPLFSSALPSSHAGPEFNISSRKDSGMEIDPQTSPKLHYPPEAEDSSPVSPQRSVNAWTTPSSPSSPSSPKTQTSSPTIDLSLVAPPRRSPMSPPPASSPSPQPSVSPQPRPNAAYLASQPRGPSLFLPHPNAPKAPEANAGYSAPLVHARKPSNSGPASIPLLNVLRMAAARNMGGPGAPPRRTTLYGKTERDLASATEPVFIAFSLEPPPKDNHTHKSGSLANLRSQPQRANTQGLAGLASLPILAGSVNAGPRYASQAQGRGRAPGSSQEGTTASPPRAAIPRPNFFPKTGTARPRSRSFSGFSSPFPDVPIGGMGAGKSDGEAPSSRKAAPPPEPQPAQRPRHAPSPLSLPQNDRKLESASPMTPSPSRSAFSPIDASPTTSSFSINQRGRAPPQSQPSLRTVASSSALRGGNYGMGGDGGPPSTFMSQRRDVVRDRQDASRVSGGSVHSNGDYYARPPAVPNVPLPPRSRSVASQRQRRPSEGGSDVSGHGYADPRAYMVSPPPPPMGHPMPTSTSSSGGTGPGLSVRTKLSLSALRPRGRGGKEASETPSNSAPVTPIEYPHDHETVQVQDMDFELIRPAMPANAGGGVPRQSEDSARERVSMQSERPDLFLRSDSPAGSTVSSIPRSTSGTEDDRQKPSSGSDIEAHRAREIKWMSITSTVPASQARKNKKVRKLLAEGVPASVRFLVWAHVCDSGARRMPGIYGSLGKRERVAAADDIERDAGRCFPDHPQWRDPRGPLVSLLQGYLTMQPNIRYQSGLTIMAGTILLQAPEEDAFWIFLSVMDSYMRPYFTHKSPQMDVDSSIFAKTIEGLDQLLAHKVFVEMGIRPISICGPWFSSLFGVVLPPEHLTRIWDLFLYDGPVFLFRVGVLLFFLVRRAVLEGGHTPASLLSTLHSRPPFSPGFPADPEAFIAAALSVKIKDEDIKKQRTKMEEVARRQTAAARPAPGAPISTPRPFTQAMGQRF